jgi:type I restriction enzyme R subunit
MTKRKRPASATAARGSATPPELRKPITILFFAANPDDTDELRLDREVREIETRISSAAFRDCFDVRTRWAVRPTDLMDAINDHRPGLVHFSGHGDVVGIREAELLQAIARVNRTGHGKTAGIVVDYYGIAKHLKEALTAYSAEDIEGALQSLADEVPKLRDRHTRVMGLFEARNVDAMRDAEAAVEAMGDERLRAEFTVTLKQFLATLDLVLPRPEGLPFVRDAQRLGEIYARARNRYREGLPQLDKSVGRKVQALIDEHIISLGIDPRIPPIAITDAKFAEHVDRGVSDRAKASEMEHAIRHHIKKKLDEDPVHYQKLSERLEEILNKFGDNWEQLVLALQAFVAQVTMGRKQDEGVPDLDPQIHAPFFDILKEERGKTSPVSKRDEQWLAELTLDMVDRIIRDEVSNVGFWKSATRQEELRDKLFVFLDDNNAIDFDRADAVADRLMDLAKANHVKLARGA